MKTTALQVWAVSVALALAACGDAAPGEGAGSGGSLADTTGISDLTGTGGPGSASGTGHGSGSTSGATTGDCGTDCGAPHVLAEVVAGAHCTCAVWEDGGFRCWGSAPDYCTAWGMQNIFSIGDNETPASAGDLPAGFTLTVLLDTHEVRCWGSGLAGSHGAGHKQTLGDDELPADLPPLDLGTDELVQLASGGAHVCARATNQKIRCWGLNHAGQLGLGHTMDIGDDELPVAAGPVPYQ